MLGRIERIGEHRALRARRPSRWLRPVLVAATLIAVLVAVLLPDGGGPSAAAAVMRTADGAAVGTAEVRDGEPATLVVNVTDWQKASGGAPRAPYRVAIDGRDGTRRLVSLTPRPDYVWRIDLPSPASEIIGVALVDNSGAVLCSGRFGAPS